MIITYKFVTGESTKVEVSEELGALIKASRIEENSADRRCRRHCFSMDDAVYEGLEYSTKDDFTEALLDDAHERSQEVKAAFSHLSEIQQKRLLLLASGLSIREIARNEGKNYRTVYESIEAAKKKFLKYFK